MNNTLPLIPHPTIDTNQSAEAIRRCLKTSSESAELLADPIWDWIENEWRALVAIRPWGPLVIMGFRLVSK